MSATHAARRPSAPAHFTPRRARADSTVTASQTERIVGGGHRPRTAPFVDVAAQLGHAALDLQRHLDLATALHRRDLSPSGSHTWQLPTL